MRLPLFLYRKLTSALLPEREEQPYDRAKIWFHAASAGELEILWPIIEEAVRRGFVLRVTLYSPSSKNAQARLKSRMAEQGDSVSQLGFSPQEGGWGKAIESVSPALFVTAKYEAWPELWASLRSARTPLAILCAMDRPSLRFARRISGPLAGGLPKLLLSAPDEEHESELKKLFPNAENLPIGDPRWDRVLARLQGRHARAEELKGILAALPRPWGILGSVWEEDLDQWKEILKREGGGTRIWVPHDVSDRTIAAFEKKFREAGKRFIRSADLRVGSRLEGKLEVIVNETGFLPELYPSGDYAYIGGGFGKGVHSTLEPACAGLPIAAGPEGGHRFPEIRWLEAQGILRVVRGARALEAWYDGLSEMKATKKDIMTQIETRAGAAKRIADALFSGVSP